MTRNRFSVLSILLVVCFLVCVMLTPNMFASPINTDVKLSQKFGTPEFITGKLTHPSSKDAQSIVFDYFNQNKDKFKLNDRAEQSFKVTKKNNEKNQTVMTLQQLYKGLPVFGSMQKVLLDNNGVMNSISGATIPNINIDTAPQISQNKALKIAEMNLGFKPKYSDKKPTVELGIYTENQFKLSYHISMSFEYPTLGYLEYFIDAKTGNIIEKIDRLNSIKINAVVGTNETNTGLGVLGDTKTFNVTKSNTNNYFYLQDNTRGNGIITYDAKNGSGNGSETYDTDGQWIDANQKALVDAHAYAEVTYDYYKNIFNRNSYDNKGAQILSTVHYGSKYNNAGWTGSRMIYGDGDGKTFIAFSGGIDVIGHELTHAVTDTESNLIYKNESGAISEAYSDIFGTLVEFYSGVNPDWMMGEDIYTPDIQGDSLRSLEDPAKTDNPDHLSKKYNGTSDYGGVHTNCGIINKVGYLISEGGTHYDITVAGIGRDKLGKIMYDTLINFVVSNETFAQLRTHMLQTTKTLYGETSQEYTTVNDAFKAVGIK